MWAWSQTTQQFTIINIQPWPLYSSSWFFSQSSHFFLFLQNTPTIQTLNDWLQLFSSDTKIRSVRHLCKKVKCTYYWAKDEEIDGFVWAKGMKRGRRERRQDKVALRPRYTRTTQRASHVLLSTTPFMSLFCFLLLAFSFSFKEGGSSPSAWSRS